MLKDIIITQRVKCAHDHDMKRTMLAPYYVHGKVVGTLQRFHCDVCGFHKDVITVIDIPVRLLNQPIINADRF